MAKKLFITDNKRQLKIWAGSYETRSSEANVLWWGEALPLECHFKSLDNYPLPRIIIAEETGLRWAKEFVSALTKKKEWDKILNYQEVSLANPLIHFLYHELFADISRNWILVEDIIKRETPSHIYLHLNDKIIALTLEASLNNAKISYSSLHTTGDLFFFLQPLLQLFIMIGKFFVRGITDFLNIFRTTMSKRVLQKDLTGDKTVLFYSANKRSIDFASGFMDILQKKGWKIIIVPVSETPLMVDNLSYSNIIPHLSFSAVINILKRYFGSIFLPLPALSGDLSPDIFSEIAYIVKKDSLYVLFRWTELLLSTISKGGKKGIFTTDKIFFFGRLLAEIGNSRNIPSFLMSLGMSGDFPWFEEFQFSKIFLYSPYEKEMLENRRNNPGSLVVTGNPSLDKITTLSSSKEEILANVNIYLKDDKKIILFISQQTSRVVSRKVREESLRLIIKVLRNINYGYLLVVKLHPLEDDDLCERMLSSELESKNFVILKEYDTYSLIQASDIVITLLSTVSIEAAAMGKGVIQINLTGIFRYTPWAKEGITVEVSSEKDLYNAIEKLSKIPPQFHPGIERFLYNMDGKASLRIAGGIEETVLSGSIEKTL